MINKLKKIIKNNDNMYDEKLIHFDILGIGNYEKDMQFQALKSLANFYINIVTLNSINLKIFMNELMVFDEDVNGKISKNLTLKCSDLDSLKFVITNNEQSCVKIQVVICGQLKNNNKYMKKLLSTSSDYYIESIDYMTISDSIMSTKHNIGNCNHIVCDKIYDINYNIANNVNFENNVIMLYKNNGLSIKKLEDNVEHNISKNIDDGCLISINNSSYFLTLLYVENGIISTLKLNNNFVSLGDEKVKNFEYNNVVKIRSIVSKNYSNYFLFQDANNMWYIAKINFENNSVESVRPYVICDDLQTYEDGENLIIVCTQECGVVVDKFSDYTLNERLVHVKFLNAIGAMYNNGTLYIETINTIMEKSLN